MDIALYTLSLLLAIVGLVGAIVPMIPGAVLSFLALLLAFFSSTPPVTAVGLGIYLLLTVAVSVADAVLPIYMTKRLGGSKYGTWGATIGMLAGFIIFPPFGIILCPLFFAILGELLHDKSNVEHAFKVGLGSFVAFAVGTGIKFLLSLWILATLAREFLPVVWEAVQAIFS